MKIEAIELRQLEIPMIEPMAAAYGTVSHRKTILVHVITNEGSGWGECVALNEPLYSPIWSNGEYLLLKEVFIPVMLNAGDISAEDVGQVLGPYKQHHAAKAAMEMAVLDLQLRNQGVSLGEYFGATETMVDCSFVVGLLEGEALLRSVQIAFEAGYKMIKLKIKPGADVDRIKLLKHEFPGMPLRVDANASYVWEEPEHRRALEQMDEQGLALIEQPFHPDRWLPFNEFKKHCKTPIALDETLTSRSRTINSIELGIADTLVIKPGMLGGYLVAHEMQQLAAENGMSTMVGGMVETALARAANLALAASAPTTNNGYPAEITPDGRWFNERINAEPVEMVNGQIAVPTAPGIFNELDWSVVDKLTSRFHIARG